MNWKLYGIAIAFLFIPSCSFSDKQSTYLIQAPLNLEFISKIQKDLAPVIDAILEEKLGVTKFKQYALFFFKRRQAITIYYVNDMHVNGKDFLFSVLERTDQLSAPQNVAVGSELKFFGDEKKGLIDLVTLIDDHDKELANLNAHVKKAMHQVNKQYKKMHRVNLYDVTKSEQFPYLPHLSLGHLRINAIKELVKDENKAKAIIESIKQRIIEAVSEAFKKLLTPINRAISINSLAIYDLKKRAYIKEQDLASTYPKQLPKPTGNYPVGKTTLALKDTLRPEPHVQTPEPRELLLDIWYPAQISQNLKEAPFADSVLLSFIKQDVSNMTNIPQEKLEYLDTLPSHSFKNAQISPEQKTYPIIIFSPGWGAPAILYSGLLEDLASHGFIVIGINYPYVTNPVVFSDKRIIKGIAKPKDLRAKKEMSLKEIELWSKDIAFVIEQLEKLNEEHIIFKNRLDTKNIGIFGHSFGGSVALQACGNNKQCIAGANIEGKLYGVDKLSKPFLLIVAPHAEEILEPIKKIAKRSQSAQYIEVEGANHGSFTDLYIIAQFKKDQLPQLDPIKGIQITRKFLVDFFNQYLKVQG